MGRSEEVLCPTRGRGNDFPLELPIKIHKAEEGGRHSGVTGNLSAAGVYIRADAALDVGSTVEFEIALPPEMTGAKEGVVIQCRGRVVRTDEPARQSHGGARRGLRDRLLRFRSPLEARS